MGKLLRAAYGKTLVKLEEKNDKVMVMDADLAHATQTDMLKNKYPERLYNTGITEANIMYAAAGFVHTGYIPFVSTFILFDADHAFGQIRNSICYTNYSVKFGFPRSGLCISENGGSHQFVENTVLMRELPHITTFVPCDPTETEKVVMAAAGINGPVYIRVARPVCDGITTAHTPFISGKANVTKKGSDVYLTTYGLMIPRALEAAVELEKKGSSVAVMNMHAVKPINKDIVLKMSENYEVTVTVEEHSVIGGLGSAVAEVLAGHNGAKFAMVGIEDKFGKSGKLDQLLEARGLTATNMAAKAKELLKQLGKMTVED